MRFRFLVRFWPLIVFMLYLCRFVMACVRFGRILRPVVGLYHMSLSCEDNSNLEDLGSRKKIPQRIMSLIIEKTLTLRHLRVHAARRFYSL